MSLSLSSDGAFSVVSSLGSTVAGAIGAAMAGLGWKRMEKNATAAIAVQARGVRVWRNEGLGFWGV